MLLEAPRFTQQHSFAVFFSTKHLLQEAAVKIILEYTYLNSNLFFKYQSQLLNIHMIYQILSSINQPGNCHQKLSQHHFSGRLQKQNFLFLEQVQVSEKKDLFSRKQATLKASVSSQIQYRALVCRGLVLSVNNFTTDYQSGGSHIVPASIKLSPALLKLCHTNNYLFYSAYFCTQESKTHQLNSAKA